MDVAASILVTKRRNKLEWFEREIEKRGRALAAIFKELRDDPDKPYLLTHDNFEHYCEDRWNMTARRTQQILAAETVRAQLADISPEDMKSDIAGLKERPLRELSGVPPEKRVEVLKTAKLASKKLTTSTIKQAKARVVDPAPSIEEPDLDGGKEAALESIQQQQSAALADEIERENRCPHCGGAL